LFHAINFGKTTNLTTNAPTNFTVNIKLQTFPACLSPSVSVTFKTGRNYKKTFIFEET